MMGSKKQLRGHQTRKRAFGNGTLFRDLLRNGYPNPSKRQLAVIDDLFAGELDEQAILQKHKVTRCAYNRWQSDECFAAEFRRRIAALNRQSELIIARYAPLAAAKLVQLTESENAETARKACLDIISLAAEQGSRESEEQGTGKLGNQEISETGNSPEQLPPATAAKLLAALAEEGDE